MKKLKIIIIVMLGFLLFGCQSENIPLNQTHRIVKKGIYTYDTHYSGICELIFFEIDGVEYLVSSEGGIIIIK